jgi:hypothetical protein
MWQLKALALTKDNVEFKASRVEFKASRQAEDKW